MSDFQEKVKKKLASELASADPDEEGKPAGRPFEQGAAGGRALRADYDPSQERDDDGKWTKDGAGNGDGADDNADSDDGSGDGEEVRQNIENGQNALKTVLTTHEDVDAAMRKDGI